MSEDNIENSRMLAELPLEKPKLLRENYDHLPWNHDTFESWKDYVAKHAKSDGRVYPSTYDSYYVCRGYGLDDWKSEYLDVKNLGSETTLIIDTDKTTIVETLSDNKNIVEEKN